MFTIIRKLLNTDMDTVDVIQNIRLLYFGHAARINNTILSIFLHGLICQRAIITITTTTIVIIIIMFVY